MYWLPYHSFLLESPHSKEGVAKHVKQMALALEKRHLYSDYFSPAETNFSTNQFTLKEDTIPSSHLIQLRLQISVCYLSSSGQWKNRYKVDIRYSTSDCFSLTGVFLFFAYLFFSYQKWELLALGGLLLLPSLLIFNWKAPKMKKYILQVLNAHPVSESR